jgi:hypothetical protein
MAFDINAYGADVKALLRPGAAAQIAKYAADELFPGARSPLGAHAGLWLYHDCLEESHRISQDLETSEGSFWHGILHRREPDPGNAAYWFRRVGRHPVFPALRDAAVAIVARHPGAGFAIGVQWDPFGWIDFWESARRRPGSVLERAALEIQQAEWELLFDWSARPPS